MEEKDSISRQLREAEQKIRILYEITRLVASFHSVQDVLDAIVELLAREFRLDACSIRLLDSDGNLRIKSQRGLSKAFIEVATRKPTLDSYSGDCFLKGRIVIVNDAEKIEKPISTNLIVSENIKSFALSPIIMEGEIIGVVAFSSNRRNYFQERFNDVIYIISNQIGIAFKISRLYEEIYASSRKLEEEVRKRTEELEEKTRQLIAAERLAAFGQMSRRIADQFRNSLTIVGGFARRLSQRVAEDDPNKEYLQIIIEEVKKLEDKVSQIIKTANEENEPE